MKILVVTSCTASKKIVVANPLSKPDFADKARLASRQSAFRAAGKVLPAEEMYTGWQHEELRRGLRFLREMLGPERVDLRILSAGYGLVPGNHEVAPYELTFESMKADDALAWARQLGARRDFDAALRGADLCFILLGARYLRVLGLADGYEGPPLIAFASTNDRELLPPNASIVPAGMEEASAHKCGLIGLKGFLFRRLVEVAAMSDPASLIAKLRKNPALAATMIGKPLSSRAFRFDILPQPERPKDTARQERLVRLENCHARPLFFLPEWDDRVDPDYDFEKDEHTPLRDPYRDDRYAHEVFNEPVFDGILVSRPVLEQNPRKIAEAERVGIHRYLRLPEGVPVLGDCGAFEYVGETMPRYDPEEMVEYYEALGFDLGVSVDHLIVRGVVQERLYFDCLDGKWSPIDRDSFESLRLGGTQVVKNRNTRGLVKGTWICEESRISHDEISRRYELTLENADKFLRACKKKASRRFAPIGVIQGWDSSEEADGSVKPGAGRKKLPDTSYASAAERLVGMGYSHLALGGLAMSPNHAIVAALSAVRDRIGSKAKIHVFGVARENMLDDFRRLGVTSADSAGPLRQAWLSNTKNYLASNGQNYVAIRVPYVKNVRHAQPGAIAAEREALDALQAFGRRAQSIDSTIESVAAYVRHISSEGPPPALLEKYRRTLHDRPWTHCRCKICQKIGIEVVIFRGNNRNRRRGFHNVKTFFERFQARLAGTSLHSAGKKLDTSSALTLR